MNEAALVREHLESARASGVPFAHAWHEALGALPFVDSSRKTRAAVERRDWMTALASTRSAWEAAYLGAPEVGHERAAAACRELIAA